MTRQSPSYFRFRVTRSRLAKLATGGVAVLVCAAAFTWYTVPDPTADVLVWPVSPTLLDKNGNLINARLSTEQEWCLPIPLEEMGTWLPKVLVAVEDKRFHEHGGVDMLALGRAIVQNIAAGRVVSGASTISSQLVRLSQPRSRTVGTKLLEFVGAWKLERKLSKDQILEYYLNRAPFGGPIRGVEAAARMYFGKRAKELSLGEASLLVGLLKGPTAYRPDKNPKAALARRQSIIAKVAEQTGFPEDLPALALEEPLPRFRPRMPDRAWHFADLAYKTLPPQGGVVRSTLDMRAQALLERALQEQLQQAGDDVTAAGIVVDNRTAAIVAYVGNARFDMGKGSQWVDCAVAPRSPGSTLKPFVYLAALEKGYIIPATLLADTPLQLGGEAPRNFDRRYRGPVSAYTALADSLNTPAVRVMRMVGVRDALTRLRAAGFSSLNREDADYGDSLVLGAGEITALELARAYTTLANLGLDRPLLLRMDPVNSGGNKSFTKNGIRLNSGAVSKGDAPALPSPSMQMLPSGLATVKEQVFASSTGELPQARQLYTTAASFLVADILRDPGRLPFLEQLIQERESAPVAFKTGTSYGLRDAWTAAYNPSYTVIAWFGRAGGGADARLLGISMAAPAAIRVVRSLSNNTAPEKAWYEPPSTVGKVRVCTLSGAAASSFCPSTRMAWSIPEVWRTVPCTLHVLRDGRTTLIWPPELEDFNRKRLAREDLSRSALIVSPMPAAQYMITPGARAQPIPLKAEGVTYPVHWYVDGEYLGEQEREDLPLYWLPTGGTHTVSLLDAQERITAADVKVTDLAAQVTEEPLPLLGQ